ncbi:aldehyde dehydrogenase family protein [Bacillus sp. HMF5848]|uniref:aldehyde dehydrogenase family protein n=1 Tax=Bacillus sp. HMF5848 TaxID=2495421 RepID=UPI000F78B792|nr:aldehyde dehydrogenase family protein [Bacillus sp. HMF5848]RSK27526.1 aldehyde dehydrogenase family protein [Bacillus sp. HMF5848]
MQVYCRYLNDLMTSARQTYPLLNPHTREKILDIPDCSNEQMLQAIERSKYAYKEMRALSSEKRSQILDKISERIAELREEFARVITLESGKPIRYSRGEVDRTIQTFKFSAIEARKLEGESIRLDAAANGAGRDAYTIFQPIGVVGAITPFNFPLNLVAHKVGPALAVGNTIIVKPAEKAPLSAVKLLEVMNEVGLPPYAYQVITGDGPRLGAILIDHPDVAKISFTGSPKVGKQIKSRAGLKKVTLELGNNSAIYVDKSVEEKIAEIVKKAVEGAFSYNGQVCISTQRIYVDKRISKQFIRIFKEATELLQYGNPFDDDTNLSALIDENAQRRIISWVHEAIGGGATLISGGELLQYGMKPTILLNVPASMKVSCEEVFGPVVIINEVETAEEALVEMNNSDYGLNAGLFTYVLPQALRFAHELEVGQVLVNDIPTLRFDHMPYGGIKSSGYGYEGIKYAMREMVNMKFISLNYDF